MLLEASGLSRCGAVEIDCGAGICTWIPRPRDYEPDETCSRISVSRPLPPFRRFMRFSKARASPRLRGVLNHSTIQGPEVHVVRYPRVPSTFGVSKHKTRYSASLTSGPWRAIRKQNAVRGFIETCIPNPASKHLQFRPHPHPPAATNHQPFQSPIVPPSGRRVTDVPMFRCSTIHLVASATVSSFHGNKTRRFACPRSGW